MRLKILSFLSLVLMLALAACEPGPQLPRLPADAVILAFGDSITYGTGAAQNENYPAVLAQLSGRRVINAGIPGEVTAGGLARLDGILEEVRPQLIILCLGGNDMLRQMSQAETAGNIEEMVAISRKHGVSVLLLGVPRPGIIGLKSAPFYSDIAERLEVPLESEVLPEVLSDRSLKSDPIHPNAAGYRIIAEAIHKKLKKSGAI